MKSVWIVLSALAFHAAHAAGPDDDWLLPVPSSLAALSSQQSIAATEFYQIGVSELTAALQELATQSIVPVSSDESGSYGSGGFTCKQGTQAFLVRALYDNATGLFSVYQAGANLIVAYSSLGRPGTLKRSAIVICLKAKPKGVYRYISHAL